MTKFTKNLSMFHQDENGHKRPILSGIIVILGMFMAVTMVGILYIAGGGKFMGLSSSNNSSFPGAPSSWPLYKNQYVSFRHPPETTVTKESPGHQRQQQSMAEGFGYKYMTGLRVERDNQLISSISIGKLIRDGDRSDYYDYRRGIREGNEGLTIKDVTINGSPAILFDRRSETVNTSRPTRSLDLILVTDDRKYFEVSTGTYSEAISNKVHTFKQLLSSLEPQ